MPYFAILPIWGVPVSRYQFNAVLKRAISQCGLNLQTYKSHSFRLGTASTAAKLGLDESVIQHLGRWQSGAFKSYIRIPTARLIH